MVVARIVPEDVLAHCAELHVTAHKDIAGVTGSGEDKVSVVVKRVYVTMLACHHLPDVLDKHQHLLHCTTTELPEELHGAFPIVYRPDVLTVVEWGGIFITC